MTNKISIIIPTLNEEAVIEKTLSRLQGNKASEVIIVDGGSRDATVTLAKKAGYKVISSPQGRGIQMNLGAAEATSEILLFLHADTILPDNFAQLIQTTMSKPNLCGGAFSLAIDCNRKDLAMIAWGANLRSRLLQMPYGDQALFTTRHMFSAVGGFPEIEIMEDFVFIKKLKQRGTIAILQECVKTSARRWQNMGIVQTTLINQLMICGYGFGISPAVLVRWYRRLRGVGSSL